VKTLLSFCLLFSLITLVYGDDIRYRTGDTIEITVFNSPEMSGSYRINTDGYIRMPLVGKIQAAGKNEEELYQSVRSSVDEFIKNPFVTVIPKFSVSVLGYVEKPGIFVVTGSERVIELVAQAGGFTDEASGNITLYREGKKTNISKNNILYNDPKLGFVKPGDILTASKKSFTRSDYSLIISTLSAASLIMYYTYYRNH
jgi:protein involved in polysaccharide export with SLBB domain